MTDVLKFPPAKDAVAGMFGPKAVGHALIVDGRLVPNVTVHDRGGEVEFILDGRFSFSFPRSDAYQAASFAAQAMAVSAGYSWLGAANKDRPFAPEIIGLSEMPTA